MTFPLPILSSTQLRISIAVAIRFFPHVFTYQLYTAVHPLILLNSIPVA